MKVSSELPHDREPEPPQYALCATQLVMPAQPAPGECRHKYNSQSPVFPIVARSVSHLFMWSHCHFCRIHFGNAHPWLRVRTMISADYTSSPFFSNLNKLALTTRGRCTATCVMPVVRGRGCTSHPLFAFSFLFWSGGGEGGSRGGGGGSGGGGGGCTIRSRCRGQAGRLCAHRGWRCRGNSSRQLGGTTLALIGCYPWLSLGNGHGGGGGGS